jgi:hypothetical protein
VESLAQDMEYSSIRKKNFTTLYNEKAEQSAFLLL